MGRIDIQNVIDMLLDRSESTVQVFIESNFPGHRFVGGKYNMGSHKVTLFIREIEDQCLWMFSSLKYMKEYLMVILAHELGHAEDPYLCDLAGQWDQAEDDAVRNRIALQIEENAWDYAEKVLPDVDPSFLKTIIFHSLRSYREETQVQSA